MYEVAKTAFSIAVTFTRSANVGFVTDILEIPWHSKICIIQMLPLHISVNGQNRAWATLGPTDSFHKIDLTNKCCLYYRNSCDHLMSFWEGSLTVLVDSEIAQHSLCYNYQLEKLITHKDTLWFSYHILRNDQRWWPGLSAYFRFL